MDNHRSSNYGVTWYAVLALAVLLLGLAGHIGYLVYPRFDLPAVSGGGFLVLAGAAGIASFFSPCAFRLLLTLLGRETGPRQGKSQGRLSRALGFAFALSIGAGTFLLLTGTVIALGVAPFLPRSPS